MKTQIRISKALCSTALAFLFNLSLILFANSAEAQTPNIIVIVCDDLNDAGGDIGGHPQAITPNMDRLQERGVTFTNAQCNSPLCGPSRASIWSGQYPHTSGMFGYDHNNNHWEDNPVIQGVTQVFEHFQANGYSVHGTGKIYHGNVDENRYDSWGVQRSFGPYPWDGVSYEPWNNTDKQRQGHPGMPPGLETIWGDGIMPLSEIPSYPGYTGWIDFNETFNYVDDNNRDLMPDEKSTNYAATVLNDSHTKPFFLTVGYNRPHTPYYVPKEFFDLYPTESIQLAPWQSDDLDDVPTTLINNGLNSGSGINKYKKLVELGADSADADYWLKRWTQGYLASVSFVDREIGRLLDSLDASPHASNTIVILTSDHGYHMREKSWIFKYSLWDEASRVPFVVTGPGFAQDEICTSPISLVDLYPSLVDMAGIPAPANNLDGHSIKPFAINPTGGSWTGPSVALTSISSNDDVSLNVPADPQRQHYSVRSDRYRYTLTSAGEEELFDHDSDPQEWVNLARNAAYSIIKEDLKTELLALTGIDDPVTGDDFILFNGDFEFGMNGWIRNSIDGSIGTFDRETTDVHEGGIALRYNVSQLGANSWSNQAANANIKLIQDTTYNVSFWAKSETAGGLIACQVTEVNGSWSVYGSKSIVTTEDWTKYSFSFTSPVTEHLFSRILFSYNSTGNFLIDDVKIEYANGSPFLDSEVCNQGFENDYADWVKFANDGAVGSWLIEETDVHGGNKAARFEYSTAGANPWSVQLVACKTNQVAGQEYTVSFWGKSLNGDAQVKLLSGKGSAPHTVEKEQFFTLGDSWQQYSYTYMANDTYVGDAGIVKLQFQEIGTFLIDDVNIESALTAVSKEELGRLIEVYPNPVTDIIYVNVDPSVKVLKSRLISLGGSEVLSSSMDDGHINVSQVNPGMYILELESDKGLLHYQLVKE